MKALITITDLTRMSGTHVCVAGYSPENVCIRPVLRVGALEESWLLDSGQVVIRPFAIVEFDLRDDKAHPPHIEDRVLVSLHRINRGMLTLQQQEEFLQGIDDGSVADIFGAEVHSDYGWYVIAGEGKRSLGTIQPARISQVIFFEDIGSYRILFKDRSKQWYRLTVTDLAFRDYARYLTIKLKVSPDKVAKSLTSTLQSRQVFFRIGLSRGWKEHPDRCFLQITGVYSFPDYLNGRCFADFALSG